MIRTDFVSNSSSSSFVISKEELDEYRKKNVVLCPTNPTTLYKYLGDHGYFDIQLEPYSHNGLGNWFYNEISTDCFFLIDDDVYVERFRTQPVNSSCPARCMYILDEFIKVFNEMVRFRKENAGKDIHKEPLADKNKELYFKYKSVQEKYFKEVVELLKKNLPDIEIEEFGGSDDCQSFHSPYENDEQYCYNLIRDIPNKKIFWRVINQH